MRPADDGCLRRHGAHVVAGARITIAGKIGFQKITLRFRLAFERPELDLRLAQAGGLRLHLVEAARSEASRALATSASFSRLLTIFAASSRI